MNKYGNSRLGPDACLSLLILYCQKLPFTIQLAVRLDLFLKASRLVKRRTKARELCEGGSVLLNHVQARPAKEVKPGDKITLLFSSRQVEIEVTAMPETAAGKGKRSEATLFRIIAEQRIAREDD